MNKSKRKLPQWMAGNTENFETTSNKEAEIELKSNSEENKDNSVPHRRLLRSSSQFNKPKEVENTEEINKYSSSMPFIDYKGKIKYFTESIDIACTCDELLQFVEKQEESIIPIGFDMEWYFSFRTGPGRTALIQICITEDICYLFHVIKLQKIPAALYALLAHKKVRLHGVNIKNDFRKLARDFPEVNVEPMIAQCLDLGTWCNEVYNTGGRWSLERLTLYICKLRINKDKKVRMGKWHLIPLEEHQKLYAAIDVYISQVIYREIKKKEEIKAKKEEEFLNQHGEKSFSALKALGRDFTI